jgi:glycosyltransferase involved in cell wall biosynthesis
MTTVSIVTPVYNDPRVERALKSITNQQGVRGPEIVVVDGGSTDGTVSILERFSHQIDTLIREPDDGVYDAMNTGIQHARGDIVGILNADDVYEDEHVLRAVVSRMENTEADTCYGNLRYVDDQDRPTRIWQSRPYRPGRFRLGWMPPHPTFFVKNSVYRKYGDFDLDLPIAADYELMLRMLLKHEVPTTFLDKFMVRMSTGGQSNESIANIVQANQEVLQAWRRNDLSGGTLTPVLKPARKIPQLVAAKLGKSAGR